MNLSIDREVSPRLKSAFIRLYPFACALIALFAFAFNWATGHRGIFLLDQSMVFDGGWRIFAGQVPYKDFFIPFGPVTFVLQALFFRLLGVDWSAMVLSASVLNVIGSLSVIRIIRLLLPGSRGLALAGGLWTAVSFQAPFGTLWIEQTAMFFDVLALQAAVEASHANGRWRSLFRLLSGILLAGAFLSKQNYGVFFVPVIVAVILCYELPDWKAALRALVMVGLAMAATLVMFVAWVWLTSDLSEFVHRVFVVAGEIGRERMAPEAVMRGLALEVAPNRYQTDLLGVVVGAIGLFFAISSAWGPLWREIAPASACALVLPFYRTFAQVVTMNDWQNSFAFVGLSACLGIGVLIRLMKHIPTVSVSNQRLAFPWAGLAKNAVFFLITIWVIGTIAIAARTSWRRTVQQFGQYGPRAEFRDHVETPGLTRVRWGDPTKISPTITVERADFEKLAAYLTQKKQRFFIMGDSTLLYGVVGVVPPQPLLYFLPSHSFLTREIPRLDQIVLDSLEKNGVTIIVREKATYLPDMVNAYKLLPLTWSWFHQNFQQTGEIGHYELWERKTDPAIRAPERTR